MKMRSIQSGMPPLGDGFSDRRTRKNEVDMMSNFQPSLRASASALGMFGVSMYPNVTHHPVEQVVIGVDPHLLVVRHARR